MASASPLMVQSPVPYGKAPTGPAGVGGVLTQLVRGAGPCKHMAAPPGHIGEAGGITGKLSPEGQMCWMSEDVYSEQCGHVLVFFCNVFLL